MPLFLFLSVPAIKLFQSSSTQPNPRQRVPEARRAMARLGTALGCRLLLLCDRLRLEILRICRGSSSFVRLGLFEDEHEGGKKENARVKVGRCGRQRGHNVVSQIRHACMLRGEVWQVIEAARRIRSLYWAYVCAGWELRHDFKPRALRTGWLDQKHQNDFSVSRFSPAPFQGSSRQVWT